ncbi:MAG: hypothetical protein IT373_10320 [Polyangiaceae bacterium]|nr:hypothetical protein [Polyangiaceae bacterium]
MPSSSPPPVGAPPRARRTPPQTEPERARPRRRALSHVGGATRIAGALGDELGRALAAALDVVGDERATRAHVHGFHSYAARMHPQTARRLVAALSERRGSVLDPFMGSGTVLVEARLLGRRGFGCDLNPLAVELAHLKTRGTTAREREALAAAGRRVAEQADLRRLAKAGPTERYGAEDRALFDVHVLLELDGLRAALRREADPFVAHALALVLSAILVKVSRQPGDTAEGTVARRLATGFTIRLFAAKTGELVRRLAAFAELLPPRAPACELALDDARRLGGLAAESIDLIVSSPPYPGVYDYAHQHAARLRWLGLDARGFERGEIGARRGYGRTEGALDHHEAVARWQGELGDCLRAFRRVLCPDGRCALVLADSVVQGQALYADDVLRATAASADLDVVAQASQPRPHFHAPSRAAFRARPRQEHVLVLGPAARRAAR